MQSEKMQHFIAFTEIARGTPRDEIKQRLIKALLNKGIVMREQNALAEPKTGTDQVSNR